MRNVLTGHCSGKSSGFEILQSVSSLLPSQANLTKRGPGLQASVSPTLPNRQAFVSITGHSMATSCIQEQLITAYFMGYNAYYPILHEGTFRKQCAARQQMSTRSTWHITYYTVLAIGEWVSGCSSEENSIYYEAARTRIRPEVLESGSLNNVQAFLLLGNYLQKRDRPNTGYNYIGIALRMALGLALHLELPQSAGVKPFDTHRRRVLFWILYCFDCWFNITTGRPTLIPDNFVDIRVPSNVDESAFDSQSTSLVEVSYPTTSSTVIALARLTKIANRVFAQFMCVSPCSDIDHQTSVMEHMIQNWHTSLPLYFFDADVPSWFLGPRQVILWKESNLRILLLLSSQRHHKDEHEKLSLGMRCQSVSAGVISGVAIFCQAHAQSLHCGLSWYAVYFMLQAALSYSAQYIFRCRLSMQTQDDLQDYETVLGQACQCLQSLINTSSAAARSFQITLRLREMLRQANRLQGSSDGADQITTYNELASHHLVNVDHRHELSIQMAQGFQDGVFQPSPSNAGSYQPFDNHGIADLVLNEWSLAADPSLQALFDGMNDFGHPFHMTE
jgi:transcriptional regulatory protein GAL4